jgi:hypothetical protein
LCEDEAVRRLLFRRSPVGIALTAWEVWRRLPPQHRRRLLQAGRRHGPRIAAAAMKRRRRGGL